MLTEQFAPLDNSGESETAEAGIVATSTVVATMSLSSTGELLTANPTMRRILRFESHPATKDIDVRKDLLVDRSEWQHFESALRSGRALGKEIRLRAADGREVVLRGDIWAARPPRDRDPTLLGVFADVTETKQIGAALHHAARSEAVASLTSGIVHDFNNLLTVLVGNLYLVAEGVRENPALFEQTKRARDVARRGTNLTRQLLAFARQDRIETGTINTARVIGNLQPLLDHAIGQRITLEVDIDPDVANIEASNAQFESVLVNLVVNARDAIENRGNIAIRAKNVVRSERDGAAPALEPGPYVSVAVTDDGSGIPEVIQDRIFEPFFSTKDSNHGTGLGLSMVRWFAEHCGGDVELSSRPGKGTTVTLVLPASGATADDTAAMTMPLKLLPSGDETILLLADDASLSKTVEESLVVLGYEAVRASDTDALIRQMTERSFDLLMIDCAADSTDRLRTVYGAIGDLAAKPAVLELRGSAEFVAGSDGEPSVLRKPFSLKDLAVSVRAALDRETS